MKTKTRNPCPTLLQVSQLSSGCSVTCLVLVCSTLIRHSGDDDSPPQDSQIGRNLDRRAKTRTSEMHAEFKFFSSLSSSFEDQQHGQRERDTKVSHYSVVFIFSAPMRTMASREKCPEKVA